MNTEFSLISEVQNDCLVIKTSGYINNIGGEKIADEFSEYHKNGLNKVIMNLEDSKVVNSIGISFLIEVIDKLNDSDGKLIFTNLDPAIEKTFTIMGLFHFAGKANEVKEAFELF